MFPVSNSNDPWPMEPLLRALPMALLRLGDERFSNGGEVRTTSELFGESILLKCCAGAGASVEEQWLEWATQQFQAQWQLAQELGVCRQRELMLWSR